MTRYRHNSTFRVKPQKAKPRQRARLTRRSGLKQKKPLRAKPDPAMAAWSKQVLEEADYKCQWPGGCKTGDTRIDAHHKAERSQRPDLRLDPSNGVALCRSHHDGLIHNRAEAIRLGLINPETYEAAMKERRAMDDEIELSDKQCPNCHHEAYFRRCGCENGYSGHDCGDSCACLHPELNVRCDECDGHGSHLWCRRCGFDLNEERFLNGHDERTPQEVLEDKRTA